jgi:uncharacterized FlaG/YvyC family protein
MAVDPVQPLPVTAAPSGGVSAVQPKSTGGSPQETTQTATSNANIQQAQDQVDLSHSPPVVPQATQDVLAYHIDDRTKELYFQVLDRSGEVIRQVPPEEVLNDEAQVTEYLQAHDNSPNKPAGGDKGD